MHGSWECKVCWKIGKLVGFSDLDWRKREVEYKKRSWNYLQYTIERKEIKEMEKERCKKGWSEFGFSMWPPSAD